MAEWVFWFSHSVVFRGQGLVGLVVGGRTLQWCPAFFYGEGQIRPVFVAGAHPPSWNSFQPFQMGVPVVFITGQREIPVDALGSDKLLEQRCRKLNGLPGSALNHNVPGRPSIIAQILLRRDVEVKFVSVHGNPSHF